MLWQIKFWKSPTPDNCRWLTWMPFDYKVVDKIRKQARIFVIFRDYIVDPFGNVGWNHFPLSVLHSTTRRNNSSLTVIINFIIVIHPRSKYHWAVLFVVGPQIKVWSTVSCIRTRFNARDVSCIFNQTACGVARTYSIRYVPTPKNVNLSLF